VCCLTVLPDTTGEFTHYNNVIQGGAPYKLRLTMNVTSPQLTQPFLISYPLGTVHSKP
jgi:hypothetical protein